MIHRGTYDGTIYHNPANKFCIISIKTTDKDVPQEARSTRRHKDHLIRFVATGYELPRTDAVELELDGEWKKGKYGMQLQVEQWHEIVPKTTSGVEGYLASGLMAVMFRTICATSGRRIISATRTPKRIMRKKKSLYRTPTMEKISPEPPKRSRRKRKRQKPNRSLCRRKSLPTMVRCRCWI